MNCSVLISKFICVLVISFFLSNCSDSADFNSQSTPQSSQEENDNFSPQSIDIPSTEIHIDSPVVIDSASSVFTVNSNSDGCAYQYANEEIEGSPITESLNPASDIATDHLGMSMNFTVNYSDNGSPSLQLNVRVFDVTTYIPIHIRYPYSAAGAYENVDSISNALELVGEEKLVVFSNGARKVMQKIPVTVADRERTIINGYGLYVVDIPDVKPGQCIRVSLERSKDKSSAIDTVVRVPPLFTVLSPSITDEYAENDNMLVNWGVMLADGSLRPESELADIGFNTICSSPVTGQAQGLLSRFQARGFAQPIVPPRVFGIPEILPEDIKIKDYFGDQDPRWEECYLRLDVTPHYEAVFDVDYDVRLANKAHPEMMEYISDWARTEGITIKMGLY